MWVAVVSVRCSRWAERWVAWGTLPEEVCPYGGSCSGCVALWVAFAGCVVRAEHGRLVVVSWLVVLCCGCVVRCAVWDARSAVRSMWCLALCAPSLDGGGGCGTCASRLDAECRYGNGSVDLPPLVLGCLVCLGLSWFGSVRVSVAAGDGGLPWSGVRSSVVVG